MLKKYVLALMLVALQASCIDFQMALSVNEVVDIDMDGVADSRDNCIGETGWISNAVTDADADGCRDLTEDVDDDGDRLIEISSIEQLTWIANDLYGTALNDGITASNAGCGEQQDCFGYELANDLDFDTNGDGVMDANDYYWNGGQGWQQFSGSFKGIFDGNGYQIKNFYMVRTGSNFCGLFYSVTGATLRNIAMTGPLALVQCTGSASSRVGALYTTSGIGGHVMENIYSSVTIIAEGDRIGAIGANLGKNGSATNIYVTATVDSNGTTVAAHAGIIGSSGNPANASQLLMVGNMPAGYGQKALAATNNMLISSSYWATDTTNTTDAGTTKITDVEGVTLNELQCPTAADDTGCSGVTLYKGWSTAEWDFGSNSQLPALIIGGKKYRDYDYDGIPDFDDDSDSDSYSDEVEFEAGSDPEDALSTP